MIFPKDNKIDTKITIMSIVLTVIIMVSTVALFTGRVDAKIDNLEQDNQESQEKIDDHETRISKIETHYTHISESLDDIKNKLEELT